MLFPRTVLQTDDINEELLDDIKAATEETSEAIQALEEYVENTKLFIGYHFSNEEVVPYIEIYDTSDATAHMLYMFMKDLKGSPAILKVTTQHISDLAASSPEYVGVLGKAISMLRKDFEEDESAPLVSPLEVFQEFLQ